MYCKKLRLAGYPVTAAVLGDTVKGTRCTVHGNTVGCLHGLENVTVFPVVCVLCNEMMLTYQLSN
jgi:hypothetical protein